MSLFYICGRNMGFFSRLLILGCFCVHDMYYRTDTIIHVRPCKLVFLLISNVFFTWNSIMYCGKLLFDNARVLFRVKNVQKLHVTTDGLTANFDAEHSILTLQHIKLYPTVDKCTRKNNSCHSIC